MKGLLFTPAMAVAACNGTKTQTRRVLKFQPVIHPSPPCNPNYNVVLNEVMWRLGGPSPECALRYSDYKVGERRCLLTTWAVYKGYDSRKPSALPPNFDKRLDQRINLPDRIWHAGMGTTKPEWCGISRPGRFLPNVLRHLMPVFELVAVRAERVQEISEADAKAEGAPDPTGRLGHYPAPWATSKSGPLTFRASFEKLWDSINAKRGFGWTVNPYVWVVTFKKLP